VVAVKQGLFGRLDALPPHLQGPFDALWAAYPQRKPNPRRLAEVAFLRAVRAGADPQALARAADAYTAEVRSQGIDLAFVPHLRTWLVQERWRDYLAAPEVPQPQPLASAETDLTRALSGRLPPAEIRAWIAQLDVQTITQGQTALVVAPSRFHADHVRREYRTAIARALGVGSVDVLAAEDVRC
jgi:hypothetical protein